MAVAAARLLSRRACRIALSSFSNLSPSYLPVPATNEALVLSKYMSSISLGLDRGNESVRFQSLVPFGRVYSTGIINGGSEDLTQTSEAEQKAPIKSPPRPFKLNNEQRALAEEIGYRVVNRYTAEDFGQNKRPKAFAVVQIGSHQFKVSPNDLIFTEKLKYCDINDKLMLNKILMLGSKDQTVIGRPTVPKAAVFAAVEEHALDEKVIIFKKKRRKNYRRTTGHRQELTRLRILEVKGINVETAPLRALRKAKALREATAIPSSSKVQETSRADTNTEGGLSPVLA